MRWKRNGRAETPREDFARTYQSGPTASCCIEEGLASARPEVALDTREDGAFQAQELACLSWINTVNRQKMSPKKALSIHVSLCECPFCHAPPPWIIEWSLLELTVLLHDL
jgi:hypothetical protein